MKLYRNKGRGRFEDVTAIVGLDQVVPAMGANFGDLDNDGFLDFYLGTGMPSYSALVPNSMFRNRDGKQFVDVTSSTGTGHLQKGHAVAFTDVNNDGLQDFEFYQMSSKKQPSFEKLGGCLNHPIPLST
ncbi:MAG: VCBS repeat-containing protein [Pyrinomonadaceae bacterium]